MADDLCETEWWEDENQDPIKKSSNSSKKKRKVDPDQDSNLQEQVKRKKKRKEKGRKDRHSNSTKIDNTTLWNFFVQETKDKLSEIELEELEPSGDQFLSSDCNPESLEKLSVHLQHIIPNWESEMKTLKDKNKGCPLMLVICASAKRSVDILRFMKDFKTSQCKTAKLFAKHFKLEDQEAFLEKSLVHIGVGTPNRILKLKSDGFLKFKRLKYLIIDWTFEDTKKRRLMDIPEVKDDFTELLQKELLFRIKQRKLKYSLF